MMSGWHRSSAAHIIVRQAKECQMQQRYQIFGMRGAGSLIAESMLTAVGWDYDIGFPKSDEMRQPAFRALNPLGKIPVLICPDGQSIC